jgi:hypothetical protein
VADCYSIRRHADSFADSGRPLAQETLHWRGVYKLEHRWTQMNADEKKTREFRVEGAALFSLGRRFVTGLSQLRNGQ